VWLPEAEKWELWQLRANMLLVTAKNKQDADSDAPVKVVSRNNVGLFAGKHFDILVMDELTSFKNLESQRTKAVLSIHADRRIGLTGTFAPNGLLDTYAQLAACGIASADEHDYYAWRGRWFVNVNQGRPVAFPDWKPRHGTTAETALAPWLGDIITMTTEDYLQLTPMQTHTVEVELSKAERKAYDDLVATLHFELPDGLYDFTVSEKARFAKVQTLCSGFVYDRDGDYSEDGVVRIKGGGAKIAAAVEFCRRAAGEGESVLLFYNYRETALWLGEELAKEGLRFASVKGSNLDWLGKWNGGELDVLVANPASAGHGLNLQSGGHIVIWLELTYNYEYYAQANARLHRTGQTQPVQVWHLVAKDTVDEGVLRLLQNKDKTNKRVEAATK
jgi:SNF2 family DNA or RNA helicase